jgi:hypothetical protein
MERAKKCRERIDEAAILIAQRAHKAHPHTGFIILLCRAQKRQYISLADV